MRTRVPNARPESICGGTWKDSVVRRRSKSTRERRFSFERVWWFFVPPDVQASFALSRARRLWSDGDSLDLAPKGVFSRIRIAKQHVYCISMDFSLRATSSLDTFSNELKVITELEMSLVSGVPTNAKYIYLCQKRYRNDSISESTVDRAAKRRLTSLNIVNYIIGELSGWSCQ